MDASPGEPVMTEVRSAVDGSREAELVAGFEALLAQPLPEGLVRTELLRGEEGWRIQSLWRDRQALAAMRASTDEPAAPALFRSVGAEPELVILEVRASLGA